MKKGLKLSQLKVKSFITSISQNQSGLIKGGTGDNGSGGGGCIDDTGAGTTPDQTYSMTLKSKGFTKCPIPSN